MAIRLLTVLAALAMIPSAAAQCPDPANLVTNCGFEVNDDDWSAVRADSMARSTAEARTGVASLLGDAQQMASDWRLTVETCVDVAPNTGYGSGVHARLLSGSDVDCRIYINAYHEEGCVDFALGNAGDWTRLGTSIWAGTGYDFFNGSGLESVLLDVECTSTVGDFQAYIDDAFLGIGLSFQIFADGFESGDTTAWAP